MNNKEFARRRNQLMKMVGPGGIVILPSAPVRTRSRDVEYRFRQDSDFYYMTGFAEPEAVAVLVPGRANGEYLLFCREKDAARDKVPSSYMVLRTSLSLATSVSLLARLLSRAILNGS